MKRAIAILAAILALSGVRTAQASLSPVSANYVAGWNMAGGPVGTDLSGASILATWTSSSYNVPPSAITQICQGYWAYFVQPASVALPAATGPTQTCPLQAGWNLIGNPFSGQALLPSGVTGWYWNPDRGAYDSVTAIPPGGAVWLISDSPSSITLTYAPATSRTPTTVEIDFLTGNPITIHVGDSIKLNLPAVTLYRATTDPMFLHLDSAGLSGDLSCLNDPSCALSLLSQFWIWHATTAGITTITVTPVCTTANPCTPIPTQIAVTILP
jgi:hypothetical protein